MSKNDALCSHTAQVPTFSDTKKRIRFKKHNLRKSPCYIHSTEKELLEDWFLEKALAARSQKKQAMFETYADKIKNCGTAYVHLEDSQGHKKYSRIFCKNEFCPTCGKSDSQLHKKRVSRAGDRLMWSPLLGYMIFTLPQEISAKFPGKDVLNKLAKKSWEIVGAYFKTSGSMVRVHLMGENPGEMHIHYNVLFPLLTKTGVVPEKILKDIRKDWADVLNKAFCLSLNTTSVFYTFATEVGYKIHKIRYALRPIVTPDKFLGLSEKDRMKVLSLKGWHNTRWFGKLSNSQYKKYLSSLGVEFSEKPERVSPISGEKYRYMGIVSGNDIPKGDVWALDNNTYVDAETWWYLRKKEKDRGG